MARERGTFNFSASLEIKKEGALDARQVVQTKAELIQASTWLDDDDKIWLYNGLLVCVVADTDINNGVYFLKDKDNYTNSSNWIKISSISGSTPDELLEAINNALEEAKAYTDDKAGTVTFTGSNYITDSSDLTEAVVELDDQLKNVRDTYLPLSGGKMTGIIRIPYNGLQTNTNNSLIFYNETELWYGSLPYKAVFDTSNTDMIHRKNGVNHIIYDESNFVAGTDYLAPGGVTIADISDLGSTWDSYLKAGVYNRNITVNGTSYPVMTNVSGATAINIYAPTTTGTTGQFLKSTGGTPSWNSITVADISNLNSTWDSFMTGSNLATRNILINGSAWTVYSSVGTDTTRIYAPTTMSTNSDQVLTGSSDSIPKWGYPNLVSVHDVRNLDNPNPTPDEVTGGIARFYFSNQSLPSATGMSQWVSKLTVAGWNVGYNVWELAGGSTTTLCENLAFRAGINDTWGDWHTIAFQDWTNTQLAGYLPLTGGTLTGKLTTRGINLNTGGTPSNGISFYNPSFYTWFEYMSQDKACTGADASTYGDVTSWARRSTIEDTSGYGWIWDSCKNTENAAPDPKMALSSTTGNLEVKGKITAHAGFSPVISRVTTIPGVASRETIRPYTFTTGTTNSPGTDPISGLHIDDGWALNFGWTGDYELRLALDLDGTGIAYCAVTPSTNANKTGWKFLATTEWINNNFFRQNRIEIEQEDLDTFVSRPSGTYAVNYTGASAILAVLAKQQGSASALELYSNYAMSDFRVRTTIDDNRYNPWKYFVLSDSGTKNIADYYPKTGIGYLSFDPNGRPVMANNQGYSFKRADGSLLEGLFVSTNNELIIGGTSSNYVTDIKLYCTNLINKSGATYLNTDNIGTITFTGAVSATYNGRSNITVNIPQGGGTADSVALNNITGMNSTWKTLLASAPTRYVTADPTWAQVTGKPDTFTPSAHTHSANDITSGTLSISRIPTGTSSSTVALGNHTHSQYLTSSSLSGYATQSWVQQLGYITAAALAEYLPLSGGTLGGNLITRNIVVTREFCIYGSNIGSDDYIKFPYIDQPFEIGSVSSIYLTTGNGSSVNGLYHRIGSDDYEILDTNNFGSITFTGAATGTFNGTNDLTINIPQGGGTADSVAWENVTGKPGWVDSTSKPTYTWSEIGSKPSTFTPASHTHSASDITSGTLALARIPTGTTSSTVALGNHTHSNYLTSSSLSGYATQTWVNQQIAAIDIPDTSGFVTLTGTQTISGAKTFTNSNGVRSSYGFYDTSDIRLKSNIQDIELKDKINLYEFDKQGKHSYGVIAQEVEQLYPSVVSTDENGYKTVNYNEVLSIKCAELEAENKELKARLDRLEALVNSLL